MLGYQGGGGSGQVAKVNPTFSKRCSQHDARLVTETEKKERRRVVTERAPGWIGTISRMNIELPNAGNEQYAYIE